MCDRKAPLVNVIRHATVAEGDYVTKAEPILLVGEAGTGKAHRRVLRLCMGLVFRALSTSEIISDTVVWKRRCSNRETGYSFSRADVLGK
jgi:hypothetical protein